jgi:hypothetical protein
MTVSPPELKNGDKLAQKLGQLQPFLALFPQERIGQLASSGPNLTPFSLQYFVAPIWDEEWAPRQLGWGCEGATVSFFTHPVLVHVEKSL